MCGLLYTFQGKDRVNRSITAFVKVTLIFFALLFTAVLIHPDVDLLDVHDVKITSVRSQSRSSDGSLVKQAPFLLNCPHILASSLQESVRYAPDQQSSSPILSAAILRI